MIRIAHTQWAEMKEPLLSPFGFKGGSLSELWQIIVGMRDEDGALGMGVGVQSVLWSDSRVFVRYGEAAGNALMADLTSYALTLAGESSCETPIHLLEQLVPEALAYGRVRTGISDLRTTFALNALVAIDQAAWALYSRGRAGGFDKLVPEAYAHALAPPQSELAGIPVIGYGLSDEAIRHLLDEGYFLLKIKIGADPDQDGDLDKMLMWDMQRLTTIHGIASAYDTAYTLSGKIVYYLDANGRYDTKARLMRLLEHAERIGALERIVLLEEPFDEKSEIDVSDVPVRCAADESVHDEQDARLRIDMGYGAMALKPIAKTMSVSLKVAAYAHRRGVPCFCADLTANPLLADWNKTLAAFLAPLPELKIGAVEMNGYQNYKNWERMLRMHPLSGAPWIEPDRGIYRLDERFFATLGGALSVSSHYEARLYEEMGQPS
ncbi:hypothetical protein PA598K_00748 [Paenibacillus sp. 598K]|uniref:L-alanine-DL-glutamate epimerase n=1 Tax=Paenibacillus sp. 598K TaxID=1117987 RepID=UPI000FFADE40|nr:L-alanine-DL-glutamate epimerase [Paenibacillus sp. 598K]GBF72493.1 hypothetical protein PA598K_00748 [Paenibacillus sp. 598K]